MTRRYAAELMQERIEQEQSECPMTEQERRLYLRLKGIHGSR